MALLGPVDAVPDHRTPPVRRTDAEVGEKGRAGLGEVVVDLVALPDPRVFVRPQPVAPLEMAAGHQARHQRDPEAPGEVVVARARVTQCLRAGSLTQRPHGRRGCQLLECLDQTPDRRSGQAVVAVPSARLDAEEACRRELAQVTARGRCADTGLGCESARRQRPSVPEREQHAAPTRIGYQRAHSGQVPSPCSCVMASTVGTARFDAGRTMHVLASARPDRAGDDIGGAGQCRRDAQRRGFRHAQHRASGRERHRCRAVRLIRRLRRGARAASGSSRLGDPCRARRRPVARYRRIVVRRRPRRRRGRTLPRRRRAQR